MNHVETELNPIIAGIETPLVSECYSEVRGLLESLSEYASITCTKIRQLSAYLHILLVESYPG